MLARLAEGGMMGMSLAQMEKSKTGMKFLNSQINDVRHHLANGNLFMFELEHPARASNLEHIAMPLNEWAVVKQIDEVPPNVFGLLEAKLCQTLF